MPPFDQFAHFPDHNCTEKLDHPSQAKPGIHPFPDKLWVVTCLENPLRWRSRYANYWHFAKHVQDSGAILITVESAFGGRHFEITDPSNPHHVQVFTKDEMFRKENLQNIGAEKLPMGTQYVAFIDSDVIFSRPDWAQETLHLLQHYDVIQMWSTYCSMGPNHEALNLWPSFMWNYLHSGDGTSDCDGNYGYEGNKKNGKWAGAPGLAWAYRVKALDKLGRLLDKCILGAADLHMAYGLAQRYDLSQNIAEFKGMSWAYRQYIAEWQRNAARLKKNIGVMEGMVLHKWHGPKSKRGYNTRWKILQKYNFNPYVDLLYDHQGVLSFTGNKPEMQDAIRNYLRSRDEDSNCL